MARQAQQVHIADLEHVGIGRTMRHMARLAPFDLDGLVLEYEGASFVGVTCEANSILQPPKYAPALARPSRAGCDSRSTGPGLR